MHPLLSRIHPSFRCALLAWGLSRILVHALYATTALPVSDLASEGSTSLQGAPLWAIFAGGMDSLSVFLIPHVAWLHTSFIITAVTEATLLMSCVAVYRFARKNALPHVAERTTWLWAFCPAMAWTLIDQGWAFAVALVALAVTAASEARHWAAIFYCVASIGMKVEAVLLWPAIAALGWHAYTPGRHNVARPWLLTTLPAASFSGSIAWAMTTTDPRFSLMSGIYASTQWRVSLEWEGWSAHMLDLLVVIIVACVLFLSVRYARRVPWGWHLAVIPCAVWPLLQIPAILAVQSLQLALPVFVYLAHLCEDPSRERPILIAFSIGLAISTLLLI